MLIRLTALFWPLRFYINEYRWWTIDRFDWHTIMVTYGQWSDFNHIPSTISHTPISIYHFPIQPSTIFHTQYLRWLRRIVQMVSYGMRWMRFYPTNCYSLRSKVKFQPSDRCLNHQPKNYFSAFCSRFS